MKPPDLIDAELARQVRLALAQAEVPAAPAFDHLWRVASNHRVAPVLRWQIAAVSLVVVAVSLWLLHASLAPRESDAQLRGLSAATERQVWRDPFGGPSARIPGGVAGQRIEWPRVQYPLVPEQRYL